MTTDNIGGVWTYTVNLAKGLKSHGRDIHIVIIGDKLTRTQKCELDHISWDLINSKQEWMKDPWTELEDASHILLDIAADIHPDLVHLNSYYFGNMPWNCPVVITAHSCVLSCWKAVKNEESHTDWERYRDFCIRGLRSANAVVATGKTIMKEVENYYATNNLKLVIYNGTNTSLYSSAPKDYNLYRMAGEYIKLYDHILETSLERKSNLNETSGKM